MNLNSYQPGERVRATPLEPGMPAVEAIVASSSYSSLTFRGLGFTQFAEHEYQFERIEGGEVPIPEPTPEETARKTLIRLMDNLDPAVSLSAATEVLRDHHRF